MNKCHPKNYVATKKCRIANCGKDMKKRTVKNHFLAHARLGLQPTIDKLVKKKMVLSFVKFAAEV